MSDAPARIRLEAQAARLIGNTPQAEYLELQANWTEQVLDVLEKIRERPVPDMPQEALERAENALVRGASARIGKMMEDAWKAFLWRRVPILAGLVILAAGGMFAAGWVAHRVEDKTVLVRAGPDTCRTDGSKENRMVRCWIPVYEPP